MAERSALLRWLVLSAAIGAIVTAASLLFAGGVGAIRPQPALALLTLVCGTLLWLSATWRFARRFRR